MPEPMLSRADLVRVRAARGMLAEADRLARRPASRTDYAYYSAALAEAVRTLLRIVEETTGPGVAA
ncbi:hypothetical protein [Streptomyces sp. NPDC001415]